MNIKTVLVLSDLHCGSVVGLAPPETETSSGNVISFGKNLHQAWLWQNWIAKAAWAKSIIGTDPFALILNGDATEGVHHRNEAEILAALIETHCSMCEDRLEPYLAMKPKIYVVKGTECHVRNIESELAKRIGAEGGEAKHKWLIRINGMLIDAAHHMGTTSRAYLEASQMSIAMGNARLNYARSGQEVPKVFLRGHRHCGGFYSDGRGFFGVTGAWQFLTTHGHKVVTDSIPAPTALILDWRHKGPGELPQVYEKSFLPPQIDIAEA